MARVYFRAGFKLMVVRRAVLQDVQAIVDLTRELFPLLKNEGIVFDAATFMHFADAFIRGQGDLAAGFVSESRGEMAAFIFVTLLYQPLTGRMVAMKGLWESRVPGHGRAVLRAAERWAKERGADRILVSCFEPQAEKLLIRLGYHETERTFERVL
jgi:GNAT superfamily N-acetyltransferase